MSIRSQTISGLKWSTFQQVLTQLIVLISGVILMRLLSPEDFGTVAMVTVISSFLTIFSDFGLTSSLIQKKDIVNSEVSSVYTLMLTVGLFLTLVLFSISPLLADFYEEEQVSIIAKVLSVTFFLSAISSVPSTLLRKSMKFKEIAIGRTISVSISSATAILMAYLGYGFWSIVAQNLTNIAVFTVFIIIVAGVPTRLTFSRSAIKDHLAFGLPLFGSRSFAYFSSNSDRLLIGRFLGSIDLGLYSRSYNLLYLPIHKVSMIITSVMFSSYSQIREQKDKIGRTYLSMISLLMYFCFTGFAIFFVYTETIVDIVLGNQWTGIVNLSRIFIFVVVANLPLALRSNVTLSQGLSKLEFYFTVFGAISDLISVCIGIYFGLIYVAIGILISTAFKLIFNAYLIKESVGISYFAQFRAILLPFIFVSNSILLILLVDEIGENLQIFILLPITLVISFLLLIIFLYLLDRPLFKLLKQLLKKVSNKSKK